MKMDNLDFKNTRWEEFEIGKIFNVTGTITIHPSKLIKNGETPRITCAATNNGVDETYKNSPTEKGQVLTVDSATIGYISYQDVDFIATDHVEKIIFPENIKTNRFLGLFIKKCIENSIQKKYGYGYKFSQGRIKKQKILLPINSKGEPDWDFMEKFMQYQEQKIKKRYINFIENKNSA